MGRRVGVEPAYRVNVPAFRRAKAKAHLTSGRLAERSGVGIATISRIEGGTVQSPRWDTMEALADALDTEVDDLLTYDGDDS